MIASDENGIPVRSTARFAWLRSIQAGFGDNVGPLSRLLWHAGIVHNKT